MVYTAGVPKIIKQKKLVKPKEPKEKTQKQILGKIGEDAVCVYLQKKGFSVVSRNYLKKWGELDIVATRAKKIYFVEVKSVSRPTSRWKVSRETKDDYRPEDNMHPWKLQRMARTIQTYLLESRVPDDADWQVDLATVYVDTTKRLCRVHILDNIIL